MDKIYLQNCLEKGMSSREISKDIGLHHNTVSYWINKFDLKDCSKFKKYKSYELVKIDTKEKAYLLGFILADGYISNKNEVELSVALADKEILKFISDNFENPVRYDYQLNKKTNRYPRARWNKRIKDITKFTGGYLKNERHYPIIREDLEKYMIQGFFDGDGCISWGRRKDKNRIWQKVSFTSQLKVLTGVQQYLIKKLNISTIVRPKSNEDCYILEFSSKNDVLKFMEHIYPNDEFIILKRKYQKFKALRLELEENGEGANKQ